MIAKNPSVGLVDDDPLVLRLLPPELERRGLEVFWAHPADAALDALDNDAWPLVVAVDVRMPGTDGFAFTQAVLTRKPTQIVVMLSSLDDNLSLRRALDAGAAGYLIKSDSPDRIAAGLVAAATGLRSFSPGLPGMMPVEQARGHIAHSPLTTREEEVLRLMSQSLTNDQIARRLGIAGETAKRHVSSILNKLDVPDRLGAVMWGMRVGIIGRQP
ncbi:MAG TPA: response regulator transcription factor [Arachnia sp.]|nr:response regulator transcription factor [Arachnia sp.]HMT86965.1 response regulator transcription factor [Arachnia sp.]